MKIEEAIELLEIPVGEIDAELRAKAERIVMEDPIASAGVDRRQQADFRIRGAFASIPVPADLKTKCLSVYDRVLDSDKEMTETNRPFFIRPWMYAAAAAVAIMLLVQAPLRDSAEGARTAFSSPSGVSHAGVGSLLNDLGRQFGSFGNYHHQPEGIAEAASFFENQNAPVSNFLTANFANVVPDGCRILDIQGYRVSMVCLRTEPFMHLFVVPKEVLGSEALAGPVQSQVNTVSFLAWIDGDQLLILATRSGTCEDLRRHVTFASVQ
jgi:hypothetical protein